MNETPDTIEPAATARRTGGWGRAAMKSLAGLGVFVLGLAILGLLGEWAMRLAYHFNSRRFVHPYLGETYKPGYRATARTPEGQAFEYRLNNYAFLGPDIPGVKPDGAIYVFTLGGSTTICNEYPAEQTWPGVLQSELRRLTGNANIIVFNAGMAGATSYRSLLIFQNLILPLKPDLVVVYHGVNDKDYVRPTSARFFRDIGYREEFLQRRSYLLQELAKRTNNRLIVRMNELLARPAGVSTHYAYHEKNFRDIAYLARGYECPLVFMTQPVYRQAAEMAGMNDSTRNLGRELNVPVYDLVSLFPEDLDHFLRDTVHYTAKGNAFIGERLAEWLVSNGVLRAAR